MAQTEDLTPFLASTQPLEPSPRLFKPAIYGVIGAAAMFVLLAIFWGVRQMLAPPAPPSPAPQQDLPAMTAVAAPFPATLPVVTSFAGLDRRPQEPLPPIPKAEALPAEPPAKKEEVPPTSPPAAKTPAPKQDPPKTMASVQQATTPTEPKGPRRWLFPDTLTVGKPIFQEAGAPGMPREKEDGAKSDTLIQKAHVVRAEDVTGMLYRDTPIHGILLGNVNSDVPGDIRFYVDRHVMDAHGQGRILIPQHSQGIVTQKGQVKFGDERLPAEFAQLRFPDGTLVTFKGQAADKSGATGLPGEVNNHIPQLLLKILASTALSVGARIPSGNTTGYQPTLPQQFAEDASRGVNQAGQKIVQQQLDRPPTITAKAGDIMTIEVKENINFNTDVKIIK